ncbi:UrcA family protein [Sandaracinobacter sp. RS1-74]|uniref:UrcA family protein n=1 Tax=Sandaracinobacteroides sayramensis TaxID=2913411 RepID=UPI001EDA87D0|nr:UrcA family protein [Sandaracinobacteroides sayramensis]MCG2841790.1 UrcA family protein [Sandaracinobacteroides sayramensis]
MRTSFAPLALAAAIVITFAQTAAFAAPADVAPRSLEVTTRGLNLANPADVAALDVRINRAARAVCNAGDWRNLKAVSERAACQATAIASAAPKKEQLVALAQSGQVASRNQISVAATD